MEEGRAPHNDASAKRGDELEEAEEALIAYLREALVEKRLKATRVKRDGDTEEKTNSSEYYNAKTLRSFFAGQNPFQRPK